MTDGSAAEEPVRKPRSAARHPHHHSQPHPTAHDPTRLTTNRRSEINLPLPEEKDAFTFAVFGDRTGGPPEGVKILKQAVDDVNLFEPDLVMTVGDLIQGYNETDAWIRQMREYKSVMSGLLCPWFPVAGNHDVYWRGKNRPLRHHEKNFEEHFGPLWYAFEHKKCWFIVLFSDEGDPTQGLKSFENPELQRMSPEQLVWLKSVLKRAKEAHHVFAFLHHPRWIGGGRYGDSWDEVHRILAAAGNVSAVFAGHIHRMRYDGPRDGIEYVTLATVGGGQSGYAPSAGYLHHYHLITVRKQQIAMACLPVGDVMDVRAITGEISNEVALLAESRPKVLANPSIHKKQQANEPLVLELSNPCKRPIDVELHTEADVRQWAIAPDHLHRRIAPGQPLSESIGFRWLGDAIDDQFRFPEVVIDADYLAPAARIAMRPMRMTVPVQVELDRPAPSEQNLAVNVGKSDYLLVDHNALAIPEGPLTLECWCKARKFREHSGIVTKTLRSEFGLFVDGPEPYFTIFLGDRYVEAKAERPRLSIDRWHHLAGVYDGQEVRFYVDGKLASRKKGKGPRRTNRMPLAIGADVDIYGKGIHPFEGAIDSVRLSATARYRGPSFEPMRRLASDADTVLLLNFDNFIGPFSYDESPGAAHARRIGKPTLEPMR